jgi:hypothetical protein
MRLQDREVGVQQVVKFGVANTKITAVKQIHVAEQVLPPTIWRP